MPRPLVAHEVEQMHVPEAADLFVQELPGEWRSKRDRARSLPDEGVPPVAALVLENGELATLQ